MKRILIFSDTHGNIKRTTEIINNIPCDLIIHLGDLVRDAKELEKLFPHIPFEYVCGNNDYFGTDYIKVVNFEGINIFCTHGHLYTLDKMVEKAKNLNCKAYGFLIPEAFQDPETIHQAMACLKLKIIYQK